ncbi:MAG: formylglycine-generating enzyme family protein [Myxococcota bacterium]|nr:formylglycine-generating enzyme family protein [Myxococcota bacterium]
MNRIRAALLVLPLTLGAAFVGYRRWAADRPRYPLPLDDARCPRGMAYIPGGVARIKPDEVLEPSDDEMGLQLAPDSTGSLVHQVHIAPFCLDWNEVTVADYDACLKAGKCSAPKAWLGINASQCNYGKKASRYQPINCVSWLQSKEFCAFKGKRLPLEDEWQYAAEGGDQGYRFPWGLDSDRDRECLEKWTGRKGTCPVRSYPPEAFGLFDMGGNVAEHTEFSCRGKPCPDQSQDQLNVPYSGTCWADDEGTAAARRHGAPDTGSPSIGFRCAK